MIELTRQGAVFVLRMRAGENRIGAPLLEGLHAALDEVEDSSGPAALVTTGDERFYSNGLDLEWLAGQAKPRAAAFVGELEALLARLLALPLPTVAALGGHAFAGGAMLALAHDQRVMRRGRGWFCLPEIDLASGQPLTRGMTALIGAKLPPRSFHEAVLTGRRYDADAALAEGIVHEAADAEALLPRALARAEAQAGKHRATLGALKQRIFEAPLAALTGGHGVGTRA